jgi:hypothetical protein
LGVLFLLSRGIHSIISFGILSSGTLLTWPYHCSIFFSITYICVFIYIQVYFYAYIFLQKSPIPNFTAIRPVRAGADICEKTDGHDENEDNRRFLRPCKRN